MQLVLENVSKCYRNGTWAIRDFSLTFTPGVWGLLGPNGAGKTTLMRMLATITRVSRGRIFWNDVDCAASPNALRSVLGYLPQDFGVYPNLNGTEFLEYIAAVKGIAGKAATQRIAELLEIVNLTGESRRPLGTYFGGMKQRIGIAQALLNDPRVLIVDEPTSGLDPEERLQFRNLLSELSGNRIILLSTHIVSDIEAVATRVALMRHGRLLSCLSVDELLHGVTGRVWEVVVPSSGVDSLRQRYRVSGLVHREDGVHARVLADDRPSFGTRLLEPSLEDAYLSALDCKQLSEVK